MTRDVVFNESASWYENGPTPPEPLPDGIMANQGIEDEDRLRHMFEESPITNRLSGPQEPLRDESTSRPSAMMENGKAKMPEYEDDHFDNNEST